MASTFFGLNIATSGLYASNVQLNIAANNIANEGTEGYSRQQATQTARNPIRVYEVYGMVGAGVDVTGIERTRDAFYDKKYWANQPKIEEAKARDFYMQQLENHMNEFTIDGFTLEYSNFFDSLEELKKLPDDPTARVAVLNYGQSLMEFFQRVRVDISLEQEDINAEINSYVDRVNTLARDIAAVNKQINVIELTGASANQLRDQRELLLDELSGICKIQYKEVLYENGKSEFTVKLGTNTLVDNYDALSLEVVTREQKADSTDVVGLYDICWNDGKPFNPIKEGLDGTLKGLLEVRDGNNYAAEDNDVSYPINYKGIPYYQKQITQFLDTFTSAFNEAHAQGENLYGESTENIPLFVKSEKGIYSINPELLDDPNKMATCSDRSQGIGNTDIVDTMIDLRKADVIENTSFQEYLNSLVAEVAVEVSKQETLAESYTDMQLVIQNQRLSVMGVDPDEETMNLIKYRESYNLNAKVISIMQEIYDKLINVVGVV